MKLKIIRAIDPYTFQPKLGFMDSDGIIIFECDVEDFVDKSILSILEGRTVALEEMKDKVKSRLEVSRHAEVDELFHGEFNPKTTLNEYQDKAIETAIYGAGHKIVYPALGLAGEAGEVANKVKKVLRDKDGVFTEEAKREIAEEAGDALWYIAALCRGLGYTLDEVAAINLEKLKSRQDRGVISGLGDNR